MVIEIYLFSFLSLFRWLNLTRAVSSLVFGDITPARLKTSPELPRFVSFLGGLPVPFTNELYYEVDAINHISYEADLPYSLTRDTM